MSQLPHPDQSPNNPAHQNPSHSNPAHASDPHGADEKKQPPKTAAQIEAELEKARADIARDIDALTERLHPRAQLDAAKEVATERVAAAQTQARAFLADLQAGDQDAIKRAAAIAAGVAGVIALLVLARRKK